MRFFCAFLALGVGLLGLIPESAEACHRRGGAVYYTAPGYSSQMYYPQPMYGQQPGLYPPKLMPPLPTTTVDVTALDDKFEPAKITIAPGTTIRWTNKGSHKHTVTSANDAWDSGDLASGQSYTATFTKAGTFDWKSRFKPVGRFRRTR
jgi:hypothetical protein